MCRDAKPGAAGARGIEFQPPRRQGHGRLALAHGHAFPSGGLAFVLVDVEAGSVFIGQIQCRLALSVVGGALQQLQGSGWVEIDAASEIV